MAEEMDVDLILPKRLIVGSVEFINDWKSRLNIDPDCAIVLLDDSFLKWTIQHKKEPVSLIQALIGVSKVSLKTTKCTIESISSNFWKHHRNSQIAVDMFFIPRVCNHPPHYLSAEACMREVLSLPKYNKFFFATLKKEVYESAAVRNARFKPVITVKDGAIVINEVNLFRKHGVELRQRVKDKNVLQFVDDKPPEQLKFVRECFGLFGVAYVLCDASFLVWVVDEDIEPLQLLRGCLRVRNVVLQTTECVMDAIRVCIKDKRSRVRYSVSKMLSSCDHGIDLEDPSAAPIIIDSIECVKQKLNDSSHDNYILATHELDAYKSTASTRATPFVSMDDGVIRVLPIPDDQRALFEEFKRNMLLE